MTKIRTFAGLLFVAILVYTGLWHTSGFRAEKETAAMFASWRDKGLRIDHGKIKLSGFPYRMVITVDGLQVRTRGPGLNLGAESVMLVSHLWTPGHWVGEATNVSVNAADGALAFTDGSLRGSYRIHDDGKAVVVVDSGDMADFSLMKAQGIVGPRPLKGWQLFLRSDTSHHAPANGLYEDRFLDFKVMVDTGTTEFEAIGGIMGPIITDWTQAQLAAWRDAGGLLALDSLQMTTAGGRIGGNASLTLDEAFRPLGSATVTVQNPDVVAKALKDMGLPDLAKTVAAASGDDQSAMLQMGEMTLDGISVTRLKSLVND